MTDLAPLTSAEKEATWRRIVSDLGGIVTPPAGYVSPGHPIRLRASYAVAPEHLDYVAYEKGRIDGLRHRAEADEVTADNWDAWGPEEPTAYLRRQARNAVEKADAVERDLHAHRQAQVAALPCTVREYYVRSRLNHFHEFAEGFDDETTLELLAVFAVLVNHDDPAAGLDELVRVAQAMNRNCFRLLMRVMGIPREIRGAPTLEPYQP